MHVYPVINGKVTNSNGCEINPVYQHDPSCHSRFATPRFEDPAAIEDDLTRLGRVYTAGHIRIMGAEPLLHPELPDLLRRLRRTGVAPRIRLCTYGRLLDSRGEGLWQLIDELEISIYPGRSITNEQLDRYRQQAQRHGVELMVNLISSFREGYADRGTNDWRTVNRIFRSCQLVHSWRCHLVQSGHIYRCPPSYFLPLIPDGSSDPRPDGLAIGAGQGFRDELKRFLESPIGPSACQRCLGTAGKKVRHHRGQVWAPRQRGTSEELLDWPFLSELERDVRAGEDECDYLEEGERIPEEWYSGAATRANAMAGIMDWSRH
jgi:hypothetical protein